MADDRYRPCDNPKCRAIDSTRCKFRVGVDGMVVPSQVRKAEEAGCRIVRFKDAADEGGPHDYAN